jgi:hypothetical protein
MMYFQVHLFVSFSNCGRLEVLVGEDSGEFMTFYHCYLLIYSKRIQTKQISHLETRLKNYIFLYIYHDHCKKTMNSYSQAPSSRGHSRVSLL